MSAPGVEDGFVTVAGDAVAPARDNTSPRRSDSSPPRVPESAALLARGCGALGWRAASALRPFARSRPRSPCGTPILSSSAGAVLGRSARSGGRGRRRDGELRLQQQAAGSEHGEAGASPQISAITHAPSFNVIVVLA